MKSIFCFPDTALGLLKMGLTLTENGFNSESYSQMILSCNRLSQLRSSRVQDDVAETLSLPCAHVQFDKLPHE